VWCDLRNEFCIYSCVCFLWLCFDWIDFTYMEWMCFALIGFIHLSLSLSLSLSLKHTPTCRHHRHTFLSTPGVEAQFLASGTYIIACVLCFYPAHLTILTFRVLGCVSFFINVACTYPFLSRFNQKMWSAWLGKSHHNDSIRNLCNLLFLPCCVCIVRWPSLWILCDAKRTTRTHTHIHIRTQNSAQWICSFTGCSTLKC